MAHALDHGDRALSWRGRAADVDRIEAELTKLRYLAASDRNEEEGFAIRTSLANMVVHAEDEATAEQASRVIEELAAHHPSRALVIIARPSEEESVIDASLAVHCHLASGEEQQVCCEEVTLRVTGRAAFHLDSIIIPLLIPDLPVVVWWTGALPDKAHLIEDLCSLADHFVIDSARFRDQLGGLARIRDLATLHDCAIGDLNYERVRPWRDLVMQYTGQAEFAEWLGYVKSIEVRYAESGTETAGQAVLLLAWLAGRFGWEMDSMTARGAERITVNQGSHEVSIYLRHVRYEAVERGWLVSVKLAFDKDGKTALFSLSRTGDPLHVTARSELHGGVREDQVRIEASDSQELLMHQLDVAPHDPEFVRLLIAASPLIQAARA